MNSLHQTRQTSVSPCCDSKAERNKYLALPVQDEAGGLCRLAGGGNEDSNVYGFTSGGGQMKESAGCTRNIRTFPYALCVRLGLSTGMRRLATSTRTAPSLPQEPRA